MPVEPILRERDVRELVEFRSPDAPPDAARLLDFPLLCWDKPTPSPTASAIPMMTPITSRRGSGRRNQGFRRPETAVVPEFPPLNSPPLAPPVPPPPPPGYSLLYATGPPPALSIPPYAYWGPLPTGPSAMPPAPAAAAAKGAPAPMPGARPFP